MKGTNLDIVNSLLDIPSKEGGYDDKNVNSQLPVITNNDNWMGGVECNMCELGFLLLNYSLFTDGFIFIHIQIKDVNLQQKTSKQGTGFCR